MSFLHPAIAMQRTPEAELMLDDSQAAAYARADLSDLHDGLVAAFEARLGTPTHGTLLDLGCGAADICVRCARAWPGVSVVGIDGSPAMLAQGRARVRREALDARIRLDERRLPDRSLPAAAFDAVIANSLLHHLASPALLWDTVIHTARPGARVFVMDLRRPASRADAGALVERYAAGAEAVVRRDFFNSLCASYAPLEVRAQLDAHGLSQFSVQPIGDLHLVVAGIAA